MSREYRIQDRTRRRIDEENRRWRNKRNYNRRVYGFDLFDLIPIKKPDDFQSPQETQKYLREIQKASKLQYTKTENETIVDRKKLQTYNKELNRVNQRIKKERNRIKDIPLQQKGIPTGRTVGQMLDISAVRRFPSLLELKNKTDKFTSQKDLDNALKKLKDNYSGNFLWRKNREYKRRFIMSLQTQFGNLSQPLQKYIERMSVNDFMNVYYATEGEIDINFVYDDVIKERLHTLHMTFGYTPSQKWQNLYDLERQIRKKK